MPIIYEGIENKFATFLRSMENNPYPKGIAPKLAII
jgi:hypothetical protein